MENSKSYESYKMLAELLNSEKKENIDKAYDALASVIESSYGRKKQQNANEFAKKRDALAVNRAKAEKYLDYFMTEKGYSGSGVEADAKLKAELGYGSDLAALSGAEASSAAAIEADRAEALQKNESSRASEYGKAEKETEDTVYKLQKDEADNEIKKEQLQND
ncbi:MAG: hypothetical protein J5879_01550, partial [Clostridia bacterium]|nr:hypothetical protein [Clostridia bacterium]